MSSPEKDRLAAEAMQCWADFQERLSSEPVTFLVRGYFSLGFHQAGEL